MADATPADGLAVATPPDPDEPPLITLFAGPRFWPTIHTMLDPAGNGGVEELSMLAPVARLDKTLGCENPEASPALAEYHEFTAALRDGLRLLSWGASWLSVRGMLGYGGAPETATWDRRRTQSVQLFIPI